MKQVSRYAKVGEGIWVGNKAASEDMNFLASDDISAIINLSGEPDSEESLVEDVDYFSFVLPCREFLDSEKPKIIAKLEMISENIKMLRQNKRNILIYCYDGRYGCTLAAGYYIITKGGPNADSIIERLEMIYFTQEQRLEETTYRAELNKLPENPERGNAVAVNKNDEAKKELRNSVRCLTRTSRALLYSLYNKK